MVLGPWQHKSDKSVCEGKRHMCFAHSTHLEAHQEIWAVSEGSYRCQLCKGEGASRNTFPAPRLLSCCCNALGKEHVTFSKKNPGTSQRPHIFSILCILHCDYFKDQPVLMTKNTSNKNQWPFLTSNLD